MALDGLFAGGVFVMLFMVALSMVSFIFWIVMLIDAIKRKYKNSDDKVIWIVVIVLTGIIGAIIYYFVVKRKNKQ